MERSLDSTQSTLIRVLLSAIKNRRLLFGFFVSLVNYQFAAFTLASFSAEIKIPKYLPAGFNI